MEMEITLPDEVPVMTLPNVTFFPQALLPLHIFEPRYRQMLKDVLAGNRLFAVTGLNPKLSHEADQFEPPHRIASVGIVRACQKNDNGTSNLLLQGLCRVEFTAILTDEPYRRVRIRALASEPVVDAAENLRLRTELARLITLKQKFGAPMSAEMMEFLRTVEDPEIFIDLAAFSLCENQPLKQKLLETLNVRRRLELFSRQLRSDIEAIRLRRKLQGGLADDRIGGADPFDVFQFRAKRADPVGNERQKKPPGFVRGQPVHRAPEISGGQIGLLEIHARKPVNLDIKQTGFHPIKRGPRS